jgi:multiple sugar transport system permease protein
MIVRIARAVVIALILVIVLLPIYWMVSTSLKPNREITQDGTLYPARAELR